MSGVDTIVVTGASGFIGAHVVKVCVEHGYNVNACVCAPSPLFLCLFAPGHERAPGALTGPLRRRDRDDPKNEFLTEMNSLGGGKVELYSADLQERGAYDDACASAQAVIHVAAVVDPNVIEDPIRDMVEPSTEGVRNILRSVNDNPAIKHFVQTSSMAAVGGKADGSPVDELNWNKMGMEGWEQNGNAQVYNHAKTEAEKIVWVETRNRHYTVSAINPAMVWGPSLAKAHAKTSVFVFRQALYGNPQPNPDFSVVDVRDVALAHLLCIEKCDVADGKRFILDGDGYAGDAARGNLIALNDVIQKCRELLPQYEFTDAPEPYTGRDIQPGQRTTDNTASKEILGLVYTDMADTFKDSVTSMVDNGFVPAKPAAKL